MVHFQSRPRFFIPRRISKCMQALFGGGVLLFMALQFDLLYKMMDTTSDDSSFSAWFPSTSENKKNGTNKNHPSVLTSEHSDESDTKHQETRPKQDYPFTFAGCLVTKDDTQILPEWLAYHYTVLPLRHLIVAVDPTSLTSPDSIFDLYRDMGMAIEVWYGDDHVYDGKYYHQQKANFSPGNFSRDFIRWRQFTFYSSCLRELKKRGNHTWTLLIDSDEYVTFNNYQTHDEAPVEVFKQIKNGTHPRSKVPQQIGRQNETIAHYIASGADPQYLEQDKPCIVFPRVQVGSKEISFDKISKDVPEDFNISAFHTLRFRNPAVYDERLVGKSMVDVSRYDGRHVQNPHRTLGNACIGGPWVRYNYCSLRVHHYTGSLETFTSRPGDPFRKPKVFMDRNKYKVAGEDNSMRGWLKEFVKLVGKEKALKATQIAREKAYNESLKLNNDIKQGKNATLIYEWK